MQSCPDLPGEWNVDLWPAPVTAGCGDPRFDDILGGYEDDCARGPGVECDTDGERAARIARASARIEHGDIRRRRVRDCDPA